jgi:hypothetical protein
MDIYEFIAKMAEQHKSLLKVVDLQNNSIQSLNNRLNALGASQMVLFALIMELEKCERDKIRGHLHAMLENPQISANPHLAGQLKEFLEICADHRYDPPNADNPVDDKSYPSWFKGIVEGGLSLLHRDHKTRKEDNLASPRE